MRSMKKPLTTAMDISPGFQIAPMIDVVFVIMLFFMAMASAMKAEQRLGLRLPGIVTPDSKVKMPASEVSIHVDEAGEISLNDGPLADPDDRRLQALENALQRLHQQSTMLEDKILITVNAEPQASYQRVIEVLGVLNRAGLSNVTFSSGEESP
ncbi:MAG: biopolymer transporter ExbD [Verrucomicrobiaceae bacterium]|nr:biopolymer transporter ExbD [Verrucomicrobiaceae bacterium]